MSPTTGTRIRLCENLPRECSFRQRKITICVTSAEMSQGYRLGNRLKSAAADALKDSEEHEALETPCRRTQRRELQGE